MLICLIMGVSTICNGKSFKVLYKGANLEFRVKTETEVEYLHNSHSCKIDTLYIPGSIEYKGIRYQVKYVSGNTVAKSDFNESIKKIIFEDGIEIIFKYAFSYHINLKTITLPSTLQSIGDYAFAFSGISDIIIPDSVKKIGEGAFWANQNKIEKIDDNFYRGILQLPKTEIEIAEKAFATVSMKQFSSAKAYSFFNIIQLPPETTRKQLLLWYIDQADSEMLEKWQKLNMAITL